MPRRRHVVATTALLLLAAAPPALAQFRVTAEEVVVDVLVTRDDLPVTGLRERDFTLLDGGAPRAVRLVPAADRPLAVLFVMDLSESLSPENRIRLAQAAQRFARGLSEQDRCAVGHFGNRLEILHSFAGCQDLPGSPFPEQGLGGGTALWDSLLVAATLADQAAGRPMVILFTDGLDNGSWTPEVFVAPALRATDTVVYTVIPQQTARRRSGVDLLNLPFILNRTTRGTGRRRNRPIDLPDHLAGMLSLRNQRLPGRSGIGAPSGVTLLAGVTRAGGGRVVNAENDDRLDAAYERILEEVRSRYLLAFQPDPDEAPGWRELEIRVATRGAEVHARAGYVRRAMGQ